MTTCTDCGEQMIWQAADAPYGNTVADAGFYECVDCPARKCEDCGDLYHMAEMTKRGEKPGVLKQMIPTWICADCLDDFQSLDLEDQIERLLA